MGAQLDLRFSCDMRKIVGRDGQLVFRRQGFGSITISNVLLIIFDCKSCW